MDLRYLSRKLREFNQNGFHRMRFYRKMMNKEWGECEQAAAHERNNEARSFSENAILRF